MIGTEQKPYQQYGSAQTLWKCRAKEVLLSGPAGTGKSRACLEKLLACMIKYPGSRALIIRKTRESLSESALVTFENFVVPDSWPELDTTNVQRRMRQSYVLKNGSEIIVGGMDKASKVLSTEYDLIYVQEAIELTEEDWETLTTRLRHNVMPFQQQLADTNPDAPHHWLKQRCNRGVCQLIPCSHSDNPVLYDHARGEMTQIGQEYIDTLSNLTGARKDRFLKGLWVAAEGAIYTDYDPAVHLVDRFDIPAEWPRYWAIDFGYTNPFVWQAWALDPDGRLYRYREIYMTQRLVEDHAVDILKATEGEPRPRFIVCDHDAEDRATLERKLNMVVQPAWKSVSPGIQAFASRLRKAGDGRPRLFFLRDSLVERDRNIPVGNPCCSEEEIESYVWDLANGRKKGEEPLKKDDHGMDATRYIVCHVDNIAELKAKDSTLTINPVNRVAGIRMVAGASERHRGKE